MRLVDANVLIYAADSSSVHHEPARRWMETALSSTETVLLPWPSIVAFVRMLTRARRALPPVELGAALDVVDGWLARPNVVVPQPDERLPRVVRELLVAAGAGGNLVDDAYLAGLAVQHRATVVTFDTDFARFPGVRWERPA